MIKFCLFLGAALAALFVCVWAFAAVLADAVLRRWPKR